jgi:hypothetical protein
LIQELNTSLIQNSAFNADLEGLGSEIDSCFEFDRRLLIDRKERNLIAVELREGRAGMESLRNGLLPGQLLFPTPKLIIRLLREFTLPSESRKRK